ncbi:polyprenyl synthetase family protein [Candidatus Saccharibacteria bacterium]|nr:polyprenyl synthetase family protein [Candidatus Saccharibacteria bacterium]
MERAELAEAIDMPIVLNGLKTVDNLINKHLGNCPKQLQKLTLETVKSGKRLRPTLTLISASMANKDYSREVLDAAVVIELIHKASTLHDSVMDNKMSPKQVGEALLAGDYLLSKSLKLAATINSQTVTRASDCINTMIDGETMQARSRYRAIPTSQYYIQTISKKTASLYELACELGGQFSNQSQSSIDSLKSYGCYFGIAFQLADDLFDQDLPKSHHPAAKVKINDYIEKARQAIVDLDSPTAKAGLLKIQEAYFKVPPLLDDQKLL